MIFHLSLISTHVHKIRLKNFAIKCTDFNEFYSISSWLDTTLEEEKIKMKFYILFALLALFGVALAAPQWPTNPQGGQE